MQCLEVSGAVRPLYGLLGIKGLIKAHYFCNTGMQQVGIHREPAKRLLLHQTRFDCSSTTVLQEANVILGDREG